MRKVAWFTALAVLFCIPAGFAKKSPGETRLLGPDSSFETVRQGNRTIRLDTGAPVTIRNVGYAVDFGSPEEMARQYLRENWRSLGLQSGDLSDLQHHATRHGKASTTVRFQQTTQGVPVLGARVVVTLNSNNEVSFYVSSYVPASLQSSLAGKSSGEARVAARELLGLSGNPVWEKTEVVAYYHDGETRLAHRVRQLSSVDPIGEWEVLSDATTGEFLSVADIAYYGGVADGSVFDPDPLSSAAATYDDPGYTDGGDADTAQLTSQTFTEGFSSVVEDPPGTFTLINSWAEIVDSESPFNGLFSQNSVNFTFSRMQDGFEASNTFFHIEEFMRYMNITLSLSVGPYQYSGGARFDPHGLSGSDNSHYSSGSGEVAFGEGGVDDAEDADVVIHELGHGIHDWVTSGGLSQVNGLSEGTGDYFAQSYSRGQSASIWAPAQAGYHYVFSWDGHNPFWGGRTTNYGALYPGGLTGSIHSDGQIWATCNMKVWDAIGQQATDTIMLEGLAMTGSSTNQDDAAAALFQAAIDLSYSSTVLNQIASIYQTCVYTVSLPAGIFEDGFESGNTSAWSSTTGGV